MARTMETLFESSRPGRKGYALPDLDVPAVDCGSVLEGFCRETAPRLPEMAEYPAEDLALLQAAIRAHSGPDGDEACIAIYAPRDEARCRRVMKALQDADRLDRVRLGDLNPRYLNFDISRKRVQFADALYEAYEDW